jgi:hypothetical protein
VFGTAENALKEEAKKPKYSLSLLSIVSTAAQPLKTRLAAALAFKNFIRHNYVVRTAGRLWDDGREGRLIMFLQQDEEGNYKLAQDEVQTIKQELVGLMISSPPTIQSQLGEAISLIADSDFWERWDTLTAVRPEPCFSPSDYSMRLRLTWLCLGSRQPPLEHRLQGYKRRVGGCPLHLRAVAPPVSV